MSRRGLALMLLLGGSVCLAAQSRQTIVSVRVFSKQRLTSCRVGSLDSQSEVRAGGKVIARSRAAELWEVSSSGTGLHLRSARKDLRCGGPIYISSSHGGPLLVGAGPTSPRPYFGRLRVSTRGGDLLLVNELELSQYLRYAVPAEVPRSFHLEALKAQAIVARTWTCLNRGRHSDEGYDFCDLTHCQAYKGTSAATPETDAAVAATQGLVVTWRGKLIQPIYHSTCGGHTADNDQVWGGPPLPYLRGVSDQPGGRAYCAQSPHARWTLRLRSRQLASIARAKPPASLSVLERSPTGRVARLRITSPGGQLVMTGYEFYLAAGRALGWNRVKSAWFEVKPGGAGGDGCDLMGKGLGHGVGLCQWGAEGMAASGADCRTILRHYYRGVEIRPQMNTD